MEVIIQTSLKEDFIDITSSINELIQIKKGLCIVYCPHTTAGLTINEGADPSVRKDIIEVLKKIVPNNYNYKHAEGNSPAHIKASLMGSSLCMPIKDNKLQLGQWQSIFFCEFDGPRNRKVIVNLIGN
jgi:secondary thiamine-phosphate synthase enzyme